MLAVVAIAVVNLMHFSQGWVQFGYRFSNDFVPFALLLVALGLQATRRRGIGCALVGAVDRDQPVGRHLGPPPRLVSRRRGPC